MKRASSHIYNKQKSLVFENDIGISIERVKFGLEIYQIYVIMALAHLPLPIYFTKCPPPGNVAFMLTIKTKIVTVKTTHFPLFLR